MQIFELHFNPKIKEEQIFDSFIYEPENIYEKKLGNLYMVGELKNSLPQNSKFLDKIAQLLKKNYYTLSLSSPEKALSQDLKKINEYFGEEVKNNNVSWLGNLNFAILSLKDFNLFFTKTGDIKILLLRAGQIIDIGKNLDLREIEPYPLKIFLNVVSGKLAKNDIILVLTKGIFEFFRQQNILTKIAQLFHDGGIDPKKIKKILPPELFTKGEGKNISGICFLSILKPESKLIKKLRPLLFQKEEKFSFIQKLLPKLPSLKLPKLKLPKLKLPELKIPKIKLPKIILVIVLISLLVFGFLIFKKTVEIKKEAPEETIKDNIENLKEVSELEYNQVSTPFTLPENLIPVPDFNSDLSASYLSSIYFLDKKTCKIIKYPYLGESNWGEPKIWKEADENCSLPKSMAVDGSIWILNEDNSISRYYAGSFQEKIELDFSLENIFKIEVKPNVPYLYLLEPAKKRVIITDKTGKIVKQFQSEKFDKLTDFAISGGGKTIYLKNDSKIYKIEI